MSNASSARVSVALDGRFTSTRDYKDWDNRSNDHNDHHNDGGETSSCSSLAGSPVDNITAATPKSVHFADELEIKKTLETLETKFASTEKMLTKRIQALTSEVNTYKSQIQAMESASFRVHNQYIEAKRKMEMSVDHANQATNEKEELTSQIQNLQSQIEELEKRCSSMKEEAAIEAESKLNESVSTSRKECESRIESLNKQIMELTKARDDLRKELESVLTSKEQLLEELNSANERNSLLQMEKSEHIDKIHTLHSQLLEAKNESKRSTDAFKKQNLQLHKDNHDMSIQLKDVQSDLQVATETMNEERESKNVMISSLQTDKKVLSIVAKHAEQKVSEIESTMTTMEEEHKANIERYQTEILLLQQNLQEMNEKLSISESISSRKLDGEETTAMESSNEELDSMKQVQRHLDERIAQLEEQIKSQQLDFEIQKADLMTTINKLQEQNKSLQEQCEQLKALEMEQSSTSAVAAAASAAAGVDTSGSTDHSFSLIQMENECLLTEIADLKDQLSKLETNYKTNRDVLEEDNKFYISKVKELESKLFAQIENETKMKQMYEDEKMTLQSNVEELQQVETKLRNEMEDTTGDLISKLHDTNTQLDVMNRQHEMSLQQLRLEYEYKIRQNDSYNRRKMKELQEEQEQIEEIVVQQEIVIVGLQKELAVVEEEKEKLQDEINEFNANTKMPAAKPKPSTSPSPSSASLKKDEIVDRLQSQHETDTKKIQELQRSLQELEMKLQEQQQQQDESKQHQSEGTTRDLSLLPGAATTDDVDATIDHPCWKLPIFGGLFQ